MKPFTSEERYRLSAEVAEHIVGWTDVKFEKNAYGHPAWTGYAPKAKVQSWVPDYAISWCAMKEVVEEMKALRPTQRLALYNTREECWQAGFGIYCIITAESVPIALCCAALETIGKPFIRGKIS